jgi:hypothetical protein
MKRFEYKHVNERLTERELNDLGEKGWELVTHTGFAWENRLCQYYVFKRENGITDKFNF